MNFKQFSKNCTQKGLTIPKRITELHVLF